MLHVVRFLSFKHFLGTSPLRNGRHFWRSVARLNEVRRHRGFLLHAVTRLLRPRLTHYYGIICHLSSRRLRLELPLEVSLPIPSAMADCRTMSDFPSFCAGSLLMITSSTTCCRCSWTGHHVFLRTRPNNRPNQVRLRYVPSTSYRFLQTPPLAGAAHASQILFPVNRVTSLASSDWVCLLCWSNKKPAFHAESGPNIASCNPSSDSLSLNQDRPYFRILAVSATTVRILSLVILSFLSKAWFDFTSAFTHIMTVTPESLAIL